VLDAGLATQHVDRRRKETAKIGKGSAVSSPNGLRTWRDPTVSDSEGLEEPEDNRDRIATALRAMLDGVAEGG
jgi:hypothetical protein